MSIVKNRAQKIGIGTAVALALLALATAMGGPAWAGSEAARAGQAKGNVKVVVATFAVTNGTTREAVAKCPAGTRIFSGGFASNGQHARILFAGPARKLNGYYVGAFTPPANINTGVGKEIAIITAAAWCAPIGQPIVLGSE